MCFNFSLSAILPSSMQMTCILCKSGLFPCLGMLRTMSKWRGQKFILEGAKRDLAKKSRLKLRTLVPDPNHTILLSYVHWASKETYIFSEWCRLKSTSSNWMIFGLPLATVLLITHVKNQRNQKCQKLDKCLQITTSPLSKITENASFPSRGLRTFQ